MPTSGSLARGGPLCTDNGVLLATHILRFDIGLPEPRRDLPHRCPSPARWPSAPLRATRPRGASTSSAGGRPPAHGEVVLSCPRRRCSPTSRSSVTPQRTFLRGRDAQGNGAPPHLTMSARCDGNVLRWKGGDQSPYPPAPSQLRRPFPWMPGSAVPRGLASTTDLRSEEPLQLSPTATTCTCTPCHAWSRAGGRGRRAGPCPARGHPLNRCATGRDLGRRTSHVPRRCGGPARSFSRGPSPTRAWPTSIGGGTDGLRSSARDRLGARLSLALTPSHIVPG